MTWLEAIDELNKPKIIGIYRESKPNSIYEYVDYGYRDFYTKEDITFRVPDIGANDWMLVTHPC